MQDDWWSWRWDDPFSRNSLCYPSGSTIPTNPRAEVQGCVMFHPMCTSIKEKSMYNMNFLGLIQTKLKNPHLVARARNAGDRGRIRVHLHPITIFASCVAQSWKYHSSWMQLELGKKGFAGRLLWSRSASFSLDIWDCWTGRTQLQSSCGLVVHEQKQAVDRGCLKRLSMVTSDGKELFLFSK